ncbi:hypothetical protein CG716_11020 [Mycolicibacterium sphagni]|uniref:Head-to-tail stopper n=1 Tax=Mycolicibacterium sphagni TaxID=1786 RepID=A0A255DMS4_9MYCO|nr:hypothetical protein CG716_11020 [Mycolicibacterium sphagni]
MRTARVYRRELDWAGSPVSSDPDDDYLGDVAGVIVGGPAPQPVSGFAEVVSTEGMIGIPRAQDSGIIVEQHDRLVIDGVTHAVTGPRQWDFPHQLTGTARARYWVQVEAVHG